MPDYEFTRIVTAFQSITVRGARDEDEAWELMEGREWQTGKVIDTDGIDCVEVREASPGKRKAQRK